MRPHAGQVRPLSLTLSPCLCQGGEDIVQGIDGGEVRSIDDLYAALERHEPGDVVKVRLLRDGHPLEVQVQLAAPRE